MKSLQVVLTIDVTNDQYSALLNKQIDVASLVYNMLEDDDDTLSFDFPAVIIDRLANEPGTS